MKVKNLLKLGKNVRAKVLLGTLVFSGIIVSNPFSLGYNNYYSRAVLANSLDEFIAVENIEDINYLSDLHFNVNDLSTLVDEGVTLIGDAKLIPMVLETKSIIDTNVLHLDEYRLGTKSVPVGIDTSFKSYMDYRTITSVNSNQYQLQHGGDVYTDADGLRRYKDCYVVAVGTYYSNQVGTILEVELSGGNTIKCIVGDIKQNQHTDTLNQHRNGNVIEFLVDQSKLSPIVRRMGDVSYVEYSNLKGGIVSIKVLDVTSDTFKTNKAGIMTTQATTIETTTQETTIESSTDVTTNIVENEGVTENDAILGTLISEEVVLDTIQDQVNDDSVVYDNSILGVEIIEGTTN